MQGWCVDATGPTAFSGQPSAVSYQPTYYPQFGASLIPNLAWRLANWLIVLLTPDTETPETPAGTPPTGEKWTSYYYAGGQRIAMRVQDPADPTDTNAVYYPLTDHLGSTSVTAYEDGTYYSELRYKPWGEERYVDGETPTDFTYTGQRSNSYIKLILMGARWYDPALGRFTSADTIVPGAGNPMAFDRYHYAQNNSVRYIDPSGHISCEPDSLTYLSLWQSWPDRCEHKVGQAQFEARQTVERDRQAALEKA